MSKKSLITKESKATLANVLNEMCCDEGMNLQQLRFFLVYLSKINPKKPNETKVTFSLEEYADVLGVELNENILKEYTKKMLRYVITMRPKVLQPGIRQQFMFRQLFSKSDFCQREIDGKWYFTFQCHEDVKPFLFDIKSEFTSMEVWNIIALGNFQDARMYMLLCQYRKIGTRTIDLIELKKMLGINQNAYPEYKIFARAVLKKSQKALKESTDLAFDFRAVGRPANAVCFTIRKNDTYTLPKCIENIIPQLEDEEHEENKTDEEENIFEQELWIDAISEFNFSATQINELREILVIIPDNLLPQSPACHDSIELQRYHYMRIKKAEIQRRDSIKQIQNKFLYLLRLMKIDAEC